MGKLRFSIRQTLLLIGFMAVAFAALRSPSETWACVLFPTTFTALLLAVLAAIYSQGRRRAFWTGFALFGNASLFASSSFPASKYLLPTQVLNAAGRWLLLARRLIC